MVMTKWHFNILLFFIVSASRSGVVHSIQCCVGDSSCAAKPVECPSNECYKLVLEKISEERGCMADLISLLAKFNMNSPGQDDNSGDKAGSSNDQCQKVAAPGGGMSLCKCTSNLCNAASKQPLVSSSASILIYGLVRMLSSVLFA